MSARPPACAALLLGALLAQGACLPSPSGECSRDADCAGGAAGSFCAEGICQGPPLASLDVPAAPFARGATATIRVRIARAHGGPARASARLEANGASVGGHLDTDGTIHIDTPLFFAPAGTEGPTPFVVIVSDDLGHTVALAGSIYVDDQGPRIAVDSAPSAPTVRGTAATLRVRLTDEAAATLQFAAASGAWALATMQSDGRFLVSVDTGLADPSADSLPVHLLATDALGNRSQLDVSIPITRLRWRAPSASTRPIIGLALTNDWVLATTASEVSVVDRATGQRTDYPLASMSPSGNLVVDDSAAYTALNDGRVCKIGFDGSVRWCCDSIGIIAGPLALGPMPAAQTGAPAVSTVIAATEGASGAGRLYALRDDGHGACDYRASSPLASFRASGPGIAPDGRVYAGATQAVVAALFDGLAWTAQAYPLSANATGQPAFSPELAADGSSLRLLFTTDRGQLDGLLFTAPGAAGTLAGAPASAFSAQASPGQVAASTAALGPDGTAFVSTLDPLLAALAPDGSQRWSAPLPAVPAAAPVLAADGTVFSSGADGTLTALSSADGGARWSFSAGAPLATAPALGCDRALYLGTSSGEILSLAADGPGLADTPWPREGHDVRGTGDSRRPLRDTDGGCLE